MSLAAKTAALLRPRTSAVRIGPIGIDLSLEAIHLVQLESAKGKLPEVRARASLAYGTPRRDMLQNQHQFRSLIKRALDTDRFYGRKAVIAMPSGMFRTMSINYSAAPGPDQEAKAILKVMKDRLDGDLADYVIDYLPVKSRSKSDERLALVAVSERAPVVDFLELARRARLDVQALEIGPVAISRLVGALSKESGSENVLVINSGRRASYLTLISGNDVLFDQEVAFGENSLIRQAAETLDMPEEMARDLVVRTGLRSGDGSSVDATIIEAGLVSTIAEILKPQFLKLVEEIKRVCMYAAAETRGGAVSQVYLLGSIARWPGSDELLSTLTGNSVATIPDPLALFPARGGAKPRPGFESAPEIVVATGAALRGLQNHA